MTRDRAELLLERDKKLNLPEPLISFRQHRAYMPICQFRDHKHHALCGYVVCNICGLLFSGPGDDVPPPELLTTPAKTFVLRMWSAVKGVLRG